MRVAIKTPVPAGVPLALALMLLCASAAAAPAQDEPHRVLVLHSFRNSLPANTDWYNGLVRGFTSASDLRIEIDIEAPDLARFGDADYLGNLLAIYRHKYRDHKPHLIIPTYTPAFKFLLDHGEALFPGIPVVFCGADRRFAAAQALAAHITGITSHRDIAGTLELALQVHPDTQRVAVIIGSGAMDMQFEHDARQALQPFEGRVKLMWLQGLPLAELTEAVHTLPRLTVILYLVQLEDRTGKTYVPVNTLKALSPAANAPIYVLWDTLLGSGVIGGRLATLEEDGFQAAQKGLRVLRGEAPAAVPVVHRQVNSAIFDGRELARWNIDDDQLPAGSRILHRQLSVWEKHRTAIVVTGLVVGLQGLLMFALLLNRAGLRRAQAALREEYDRSERSAAVTLRLRGRLARFAKERTLGTMATTIAHEINQPLIAIQNYAQAARRRLQSNGEQKLKLSELLGKVELQSRRAGEIVKNVRTLVNTQDAELRPMPLCPVLEQVIEMLEPEIANCGCSVKCRPAADLPEVLVDTLQIQSVLVNLLHNAMHSMARLEDKADKLACIDVRRISDQAVEVSVADRGPGIPPDRVADIFEPLYSGKVNGMGMGLAICQSIIEAHGGRIWYTPNPSGGAIFQFTLRPAGT